MKTNAKHYLSLGVVTGCMLLAACVDDSYDLEDVDWTIGSNVDLKLPYCSTDSILLRNIMDLEEDGVVQYVWSDELQDSIFCVKQSGKADIQPVNVEDIRIRKPEIENINATVPLDLFHKINRRKINVPITVPGGGGTVNVNVPDKEYFYVIQAGSAVNHIEENAQARDINRDVVSIESVTIKENTATLEMEVVGLPDFVTHIYLNDLTLEYPKGLQIGKVVFRGNEIAPGRIANNQIKLTIGETRVPIAEKLKLTISFTGITEGEDFVFDKNAHTATIKGGFSVTGSFGLKTAEFDADGIAAAINALPAEDIAEIQATKTLDKVMPENITFNGSASFGRDIEVDTFTGELRHEVSNIDPIMLDDLPNFLNDDEVILDLENPILFLKAKSQIPATATTSITVKNVERGISITAPNISVVGDATGAYENQYYLADNPAKYLPSDYSHAQRITTTGNKVSELIRKIPHQIDIEVAAVTLRAENLSVTRNYEIDVEYEVFAPISFGKDFLLVYRDTERGWADDIEDMEDVDFGYLQLTAKAFSDLPATTTLKLTPIDENGMAIPQLEVNTISVPANANGADVTFTIKPKTGYTLNDILNGNEQKGVKKIDGVQYEARLAGTSSGGTLKRKAYMILRQMQVTIKGGVTIDAN